MKDFNDLIDLIHKTRNKSELKDLLLGITTPREREEFAQRLEIMKRLIARQPQHKIAQEIGVGIATVTRGSKELAQGRFKVLRNQ